jgi:peptidoglycan/LPS O-acetylase OafA/YrhL
MLKFKALFKNHIFMTALGYIGASAFCLLLSSVYNLYSHDVYSNYMSLLFLWPLCGGMLATLGVKFAKGKQIRIAFNTFSSGIATLSAASVFKGILDIAHATSTYEILFWVVGIIMTTLGVLFYIITLVLAHQESQEKNNI